MIRKLAFVLVVVPFLVGLIATPANAEELEVEISVTRGKEPTCATFEQEGDSFRTFRPQIKVDIPSDVPSDTYWYTDRITTSEGEVWEDDEGYTLIPLPNGANDFRRGMGSLRDNPGEKWIIGEVEIWNIKTGALVFEWSYKFIMEDYLVCLNRRQAAATSTTTSTTTTTTVAPTTTTIPPTVPTTEPPANTTLPVVAQPPVAEASDAGSAISTGWWVGLAAFVSSAGAVWFRRRRTS